MCGHVSKYYMIHEVTIDLRLILLYKLQFYSSRYVYLRIDMLDPSKFYHEMVC